MTATEWHTYMHGVTDARNALAPRDTDPIYLMGFEAATRQGGNAS